ncbi:hypothetical protein HY948_04980 [Candidatus Gottesmanbacteria bacterium]|nr:hypothetical protein [Candidatus Gottesmanbacteria bacterium]
MESTPLGGIGGEGLGPFGTKAFTGESALAAVTGTISAIIGFMTVCAAVWFLINFVIGGFSWITAAGDKAKLQEAQSRLYNAFIGLVVVVAGWGILALAGQFFGYDIIVSDPATVIKQLQFK